MRKSVYILGFICLCMTMFAIIFKLSHWPGAGLLLTIGLGATALVYLPLAWTIAMRHAKDKLLKLLYTSAFISFAIVFIGMLFKVMHWPGAGLFLIVGIPLPFVFFLPVYVVYHIRRKLKTDLNFFAILLFMIYIGIFTTILAIGPRFEMLGAHALSANKLSGANLMLAGQMQGREGQIAQKTMQLHNELELIKQKLVIASSPENSQMDITEGNFDYNQLIPKEAALSVENLNHAGFEAFNDGFRKYKQMITDPEKSRINRLLDEIDAYRLPTSENADPYVARLPLIAALNVLTDWQNKLLLISYLNHVN
jgi:hypothetical protein